MTTTRLCKAETIATNNGRPYLLSLSRSQYWSNNQENRSSKMYKSVQTAFSSVDFKSVNDKSTFCNDLIRSKSQDDFSNDRRRTLQEKERRDHLLLQEEVCEWFHIYSNKKKVNFWADKLERMAQKLRRPGGEEKLRSKIEKYLDRIPSQLSDDERREFRQQLPNDIIRKLKKMYLKNEGKRHPIPINVFRLELPKCYYHYEDDKVETIITNWVKSLNFKRDFLGTFLKRTDISDYIIHKLKPLVDMTGCNVKHKHILRTFIIEILEELPIAYNGYDKNEYVSNLTDALLEKLLGINKTKLYDKITRNVSVDCQMNIPERAVQHNNIQNELKSFITGEINEFLEKSGISISTEGLELIGAELADIIDSVHVEIYDHIKYDISRMLQEVGNVPLYQADSFAETLSMHVKDMFYRKNRINDSNNKPRELRRTSSSSHSESYFVFHSKNQNLNERNTKDLRIRERSEESDIHMNLNNYTKLLIEQINKWLNNMDVTVAQYKASRVVAVEGLAADIAHRRKYLELSPNSNESDELENLKYQIFKWINKLLSEDNMAAIERANDLMQRIQNIPVPRLIKPQEASYQDLLASNRPQAHTVLQGTSNQQPYIELLTDDILDWFHKLSRSLHSLEDADLNIQLIKNLAERISNSLKLSQNFNDVIDKEVNMWAKKTLKETVHESVTEDLKHILRTTLFRAEGHVKNGIKKEKLSVRKYEDIIDDWIDTIPLEPKDETTFIDTRNEYTRELAAKVYSTKAKLAQSTNDIIYTKVKDDIVDWLKKLPLHSQANKKSHKDRFAIKLVKKIQECNLEDSTDLQDSHNDQDLEVHFLETTIVDWLRALPLYQNIIVNNIQNQEQTIQDLTSKFNQGIQGLPLNVASQRDRISLEKEQKQFVQSFKRLRAAGSDHNVLKQEIMKFIKKITISLNLKCNEQFINQEVEKLLKQFIPLPEEGFLNKVPLKNTDGLREAITNWFKSLPLESFYFPREVQFLIGQMTEEITKQIIHHQYGVIEDNQDSIEHTIYKYLQSFPLKLNSQSDLFNIVTTLYEDIKNLCRSENNCNIYNNVENGIVTQNMTVYGVALEKSRGNDNGNKNTDISLPDINKKEEDTDGNIYLNQLTEQIDEWLTSLQIPEVEEEENEFRDVVVRDLAGDIVDRHKYLKLNPSSRGTDEDELEHLKYQIFKWINKLVGEDNLVTVEHASELLQRIQALPVPILVKSQDVAKSPPVKKPRMRIAQKMSLFSPAGSGGGFIEKTQNREKRRYSSPGNTKNLMVNPGSRQEPMNSLEPQEGHKINSSQGCIPNTSSGPSSSNQTNADTNTQYDLATFGPVEPDGGLREPQRQVTFRKTSSSGVLGIPTKPQSITQCKTVNEAFEFFYNAIREKSEELPLATPTPEQETLAVLAKRAMFNAIVMNFHNMKSDPEIGNDYGQFELILEDRLDLLLDCLSQTPDMLKVRQVWKVKVIQLAIDLLKYIHKATDSQSFRRQVERGIRRSVIKINLEQKSDRIMHDFVVKTANDFILYSNYKEVDSLKANVYRQRLMKKLEELAQYVTSINNTEFRFINRVQLCQDAFKVLETVPIPRNDELKDEADMILIDEEIEQWYNELPVKPISSESDNVLRNRMRELLAKKIHEMEIQTDIGDPSMERLIKHEVSLFLHEHGQLQDDQDLNINFMVEELNNRLKNRRQKREVIGYQTFRQDKPLSSTFANPDPVEALASLVDVQTDTGQYIRDPSDYPTKIQMPRETITNQQVEFRQGIQGDPSRLNELDAQTAGYRYAKNSPHRYVSNSPKLQSMIGQVSGAGRSRQSFVSEYPPHQCTEAAQICNHVPVNAPIFQGLIDKASGANNQRLLGSGIQDSGASSQGIGPCSFSGQYTGSGKFLSDSPKFIGSPELMSAQAKRSTARVGSKTLPADHEKPLEKLEEDEERVEGRERCRCMERFRKRMRNRYCYSCDDNYDDDDYPPFRPIPFPCRCRY